MKTLDAIGGGAGCAHSMLPAAAAAQDMWGAAAAAIALLLVAAPVHGAAPATPAP
eukprot:COSAG06_NODE_39617_length_410_cov_1.700965_1_plen_54_part_10